MELFWVNLGAILQRSVFLLVLINTSLLRGMNQTNQGEQSNRILLLKKTQ